MNVACPLAVSLIVLVPTAGAQWSGDPAANLSLADAPSDQTQPKVAPTPDGGVFVSWFDGIANGFDVRVQRLDADGLELLPHQGTLVADRGFSSTQDYGIATHASGDALLSFRDDRFTGVQITAARIAADGSQPWGPTGVQLTNTNTFVANPKIAGTADGGAVVAWTEGTSVRLQRLDASGATAWASDVVFTPGAGSYSTADLHAAGDDVIVSMVHQTGGFTSPKRLVTQKLDATGAPLWGAAPIAVFDSGSLQIGNFPSFTPDGGGGAVFAWYLVSPLQCYVQRILADGSEAFPHNGVAVSTDATRLRVSPSASFSPETGETLVSWEETDSSQALSGLYSQRLGPTGQRLWGPNGQQQVPLGTTQISNVRTLAGEYDGLVFYVSSASFGQDVIRGFRLDGNGATLTGPFDVSSTPSGKSRLAAARSDLGQAILAWTDDRLDAGDIYGQNVHCDTSLGPLPASAPWTDVGGALTGFSGPPSLSGSGSLCHEAPFAITLDNARPNSTAALIVGLSAVHLPLLGGTLVPSPDLVFAGLPTGPGGTIELAAPLPAAITPGLSFYLQYWIVDAAGPFGVAASNGLKASAP